MPLSKKILRHDIFHSLYIITSYAFLFENVTKYKLNETFKILFYLDFLKIFDGVGRGFIKNRDMTKF